jgi:hypothetical protein
MRRGSLFREDLLADAGAALHMSSTGGLIARPAESEHPGAEINHFQEQQRLQKQRNKKLNLKIILLLSQLLLSYMWSNP